MRWIALLVTKSQLLQSLFGLRQPVSWNKQDRYNLQIFLRSQSGQRLLHLIRNATIHNHLDVYRANSQYISQGWEQAFGLICNSAKCDPLTLATHNGQVSLTDNKEETSETAQPEDESAPDYGHLGSSIGI